MAVRRSAPDPDTAELARRRLSLLGAELAPVAGHPSDSEVPPDPLPAQPETVPGAHPGRHAEARVTRTGRLTDRLVDALPPTMHGRVGISAHHVTVVALLLAAAMTAATWTLLRAEPQPLPEHASLRLPAGQVAGPPAPVTAVPAVPSAPAVPVAGVGVPTAAATGEVVVHVAGRVRQPGVVELPAGSRVVDAIEAAGGARPGAHLGMLNLARLLVDGEQIAVGVPGAAAAPSLPVSTSAAVVTGVSDAPTALVNINTASQAELEELPGVGPVTATSIIEWRTENGGFSTVDELVEVSGIGEVTLAELRDLVTV
jgi:competence protein ComEA